MRNITIYIIVLLAIFYENAVAEEKGTLFTFYSSEYADGTYLNYSLGLESILGVTAGIGCMNIALVGEGYQGIAFEGRIGQDGYCVDVHFVSMLQYPVLRDFFICPAGVTVGLSYLVSEKDGLIYSGPTCGIGISGRLQLQIISIYGGIYRELENTGRDMFYTIGVSWGF